ncbi:hypothetical protein [Donghicola tyrosinivorans]|uniref:Uncharacterized protein n=1 Tax=Donghicola tyrosinivorans TaxID=1652492 RepID=A0A2T0WPV6_9RHOB|nr:hypothetical protein [Donghicola tyrosinivorans]PRY88729.1 hypothetical protein CLV74_10771 [Donghicola tyrosinivorans]
MLRSICTVVGLAAFLATPIMANAATVESCRVNGTEAYACVVTPLPTTGNYMSMMAFGNISQRDVPDFLLKGLSDPALFEVEAHIGINWKNLGVWRRNPNVPDYMCLAPTQALAPSDPTEVCMYFRLNLGSN